MVYGDARTAALSSFAETSPNGTWTLFVADTELNGTAKLDSWSVSMEAVPEPAVLAFFGLVGVGCFTIRRVFMK